MSKPTGGPSEGLISMANYCVSYRVVGYDNESVHLHAIDEKGAKLGYFSIDNDAAERIANEMLAAVEKNRRRAKLLAEAEAA